MDRTISRHYCLELEKVVEVVQQLSLARDLGRISEIVRHEARELSGADGASFILREGDRCYYADEEAIAPLWKGRYFPIDGCVSGWAMKHGQPIAIEDIYADPRVPAEAYRPTFVKSLLIVPIRAPDSIGAIGNYWAHPHRPSAEEIHLLQALANTTAVALENVQLYSGLEQRVRERTAALEGEIAERKRVQVELEESRSRLAAILDSLSEGVIVFDLAGQVLNMNPVALRLHGFTDVAQARRRLPEFADSFELRTLQGAVMPLGEWPLAKVLRGESFTDLEIEVRRKGDGDTKVLSYGGTTVRGADGLGILGVLTLRDVTERKRGEAAIQRLNAELEERVRERTAELQRANDALLHTNMELQHFAHATAHDLRTPLRAIAGFARLLQREAEGCGGAHLKEWSSLVIDNTRRLQTLIEDLLSYTRLDAQGLPFEVVDLREVFEEALASLAVLILETGAEVRCGHLPTLSVERSQIAQVLQNLIENGIKYNQSKPPRVSVASEFQDDQWLISVADNGIGIDPRHHERIFEIFRRLHTYSEMPGTGIGLALCRRIVERHGGHIWVESRPGAGSTFYFTLPDPGSQKLKREP